MGDGALMCSLNLSPKVLPDSPMYSSSKSTLPKGNGEKKGKGINLI